MDTLTIPIFVMIMGATTLVFALAVFQPMAELINSLSRIAMGPHSGAL
jgi:hypothetical protein